MDTRSRSRRPARHLLAVVTLLSSCSLWGGPSDDDAPAYPLDSIEVFMSRPSLAEVEFEHVKLAGRTVFAECGTLRNGRHFAETEDVTRIRGPVRGLVERHASDFLSLYHSRSWEWEKPGTNVGLNDPGELSLRLRSRGDTVDVKTSLDGISDARTKAARSLRTVVKALRGAAGGTLCGNKSFYGIGYTEE